MHTHYKACACKNTHAIKTFLSIAVHVVELLNIGHTTGNRLFFVCPFTEQRPTYYKDTTNLCMIHVYYIIVTIIIMHYNKSSIYHGIYSIIIMIAIASLIVFAEVTGERVTGKQELRI